MVFNCKAIYYLDDYKLFKNIQIDKYCKDKSISTPSLPELDVVIDLINDTWCDLLATGYINSKSENEKKKIFKSITIIFPYTTIPTSWLDGIDYVDFRSFHN